MPAQPGMIGAGQKPMGIGPPRAGGGRGRGYAGARGRGALGRGGHRGGGMAGRRPISQQQPIAPGAMPQADRFYMPPRAADGTAAAVPTGAAIGPLIMAGPPGGAPASLAQRSKSAAAAASGPFGGYGGNPPPTAGLQNMRIASGPDPRAKQGQPTGRGNGQPSQGETRQPPTLGLVVQICHRRCCNPAWTVLLMRIAHSFAFATDCRGKVE